MGFSLFAARLLGLVIRVRVAQGVARTGRVADVYTLMLEL